MSTCKIIDKYVNMLHFNIIQVHVLTGFKDNSSLFDSRPDLLSEAGGWRQQIRSRVKQNCCCPRNHSITDLLYTFIFSKLSYFDAMIIWFGEPMKKKRLSVNSSILGNRSMNSFTGDRSIEQCCNEYRDFFVKSQNVLYLLYWFSIGEKMMVYNN